MHKATFYPLGNADCCLIDLKIGETDTQKILFDYAAMRDAADPQDKRIDLPETLRTDLKAAKRDFYDVVAFSHLDNDHIHGASEFFHLRHAAKHQGEGRIKINMLWVPAAVIVEEACEDEAKIIQAEARYRLKQKDGIRVFSRPDTLKDWLGKQGMTLESVKHLITDAGQYVPGYDKLTQGVEFFVHSPFAYRQNGVNLVDRNADCLVMQATFDCDGHDTRLMLAADVTHDVLADIVRVTKAHDNEERLEWDIFKLPHHCSYLSLGPEKGKEKTKPVEEVAWIFEEQAGKKPRIISTSWAIPTKDTDQPPHVQAARYHRDNIAAQNGQFLVTMEHPSIAQPKPLVILIDGSGATVEKKSETGAGYIPTRPAPRAGSDD